MKNKFRFLFKTSSSSAKVGAESERGVRIDLTDDQKVATHHKPTDMSVLQNYTKYTVEEFLHKAAEEFEEKWKTTGAPNAPKLRLCTVIKFLGDRVFESDGNLWGNKQSTRTSMLLQEP
ncbi:hypothetical protein Ocin01_03069 [Orchesella cincta]|uniref:Uncharacterized protein n=1 Tax=Orchesella cincta TaxID=48709 RepID=A0A1D2NEB7_ORCCI|nr:hypothetical protein Ocin01_03069 [Orchesella cincta]